MAAAAPSPADMWLGAGKGWSKLMSVCRLDSAGWLVLSGEPVPDLNMGYVCGAGGEKLLVEYAKEVQKRGLPALLFIDSALKLSSESLVGLTSVGRIPQMVFDPTRNPPAWLAEAESTDGYVIERATTAAQVDQAQEIVSKAFKIPLDSCRKSLPVDGVLSPGVNMWLARKDGRPFSSVTTVPLESHPHVVGIWCMASDPELQRKGSGRALLRHAIRHHVRSGATLFFLGATPAGKPLYDNLGFYVAQEMPAFLVGGSPPPPHSSPQ